MRQLMSRVLTALLVSIVVSFAAADVTFFIDDVAGFNAATTAASLTLAGTEDFEGSTLPPASVDVVSDPLAPGVANLPWFPAGTRADAGVTVQSNTLGGNPTSLSPRGSGGLATASAGLAGTPTDQVSNSQWADSFDVLFGPDNGEFVRGVGMAPLYFDPAASGSTSIQGSLEIRVYAADQTTLLGTQTINGVDYSTSSFFGVVTTNGDLIGRINIWDFDAADDAQGADDIQVWTSTNVPVEFSSFVID